MQTYAVKYEFKSQDAMVLASCLTQTTTIITNDTKFMNVIKLAGFNHQKFEYQP